jgi:ribulose-phosphate 3-epimerase
MSFKTRPVQIIPAIIGADFGEIREKLSQLEGHAPWVSLDVIDGRFAPQKSWGNPADLKEVRGQVKIEVHLMVEEPENQLREWLEVADRVMVHYESTDHLAEVLEAIKSSPSQVGLALLVPTPLEVVVPYMELVDVVQLMGIAQIGSQGQPFAPETFTRLKVLREGWPNVKIEIDGGVSEQNIEALAAAGADYLIAGSAIWRSPDPLAALNKLYALTRRES